MEITCNYCNKKFDYKSGPAHYNRSKKHYCSIHCLCESNRKYKEYHSKKNKKYLIWCSAKKRAKIKNMEFNITVEDIPDIPKYCSVLGIELKSNSTNSPLDSSPSIDRIDSSKGYVKGNIRIISNRANRIKSDATIDELRKVLKDYEKILHKD